MKHAAAARRELGTRTIFNVLGPLTNPASAPNQVIGVFSANGSRCWRNVLKQLGSRHVMLVHSNRPGRVVDRRSIGCRRTQEPVKITRYSISPTDYGIDIAPLDGLYADSPAPSLALVKQSLNEPDSSAAQIVALNAGAAIYVSGVATSLANGITMAQDAIASGLANERFDELVRITSLMGER